MTDTKTTSQRGRKREPVAEFITECGVLVKHTHDVDFASRLARQLIAAADEYTEFSQGEDDPAKIVLPSPRCAWVRVIHCLPNSYGEAEGWKWTVHPAKEGERGAFKAVEFYS